MGRAQPCAAEGVTGGRYPDYQSAGSIHHARRRRHGRNRDGLRPGSSDKKSQALNGGFRRITAETFIEATYQIQATRRLQVQPDAQYVRNPDAGIANPDAFGGKDQERAGLGRTHKHHILTREFA
jgi:carbohydrate-selective porin OprB